MTSNIEQARDIERYKGMCCIWSQGNNSGCHSCICKDLCGNGWDSSLEELAFERMLIANKHLRVVRLQQVLDENH